jgi:hypothetical protein
MSATWHDPLSVPPEPADAPEHTGGGKLYMRRHDGSLRNPTGRELEEHGHHGVAPVDVEQREDDWQRWLTRVQDDVNADT